MKNKKINIPFTFTNPVKLVLTRQTTIISKCGAKVNYYFIKATF